MAVFKEQITLKVRTNKDADVEEVTFAAGDEVRVVRTWDDFYLIRDAEGHYYNVSKQLIQE